jgi:hypothetical protein
MGAGVAVGVAIGGPAETASTSAKGQRADHQSNSGPTCRLASSPEVGPGPLSVPWIRGTPYYGIKAWCLRSYP